MSRGRRKRLVRGRTIDVSRLARRELEVGRRLYPEQPGVDYERPKTRGDCERLRGRDKAGKLNACCFVSCKWNLYLDVQPRTGAIKLNFPDLEPHELEESCALDVAERHDGLTLEQVADLINVTPERVRQLEARSLLSGVTRALVDHADGARPRVRKLPLLEQRRVRRAA